MNKINNQFVSIDVIASRITKHPLLKNINYEDIVSHTVDVLRLVGATMAYEETYIYKEIIEGKIKMPDDNLNIKSIDYMQGGAVAMNMATDGLHNHLQALPQRNSSSFTYSVNGGIITTNQSSGTAFIVYDKLKTCDSGFPMIPDNVSLIKAIESYIKVQAFEIMVDLGKINEKTLHRAETDYSWYMGKAQSDLQGLFNDDDIESFINTNVRLFPQGNTHANRGMFENIKELRYKK